MGLFDQPVVGSAGKPRNCFLPFVDWGAFTYGKFTAPASCQRCG